MPRLTCGGGEGLARASAKLRTPFVKTSGRVGRIGILLFALGVCFPGIGDGQTITEFAIPTPPELSTDLEASLRARMVALVYGTIGEQDRPNLDCWRHHRVQYSHPKCRS